MRLLIVEDDKKIASFIKKGLTEAGFSVDHAENGEDGLHFGLTEQYDAMVVDIMLPKMDGLTLIEHIRKKGKNTPILILSAKHSVTDRVKGIQRGGDDYLIKPFAFSELLVRIQALIRRASGSVEPSSLKVGNLEMDLFKREVRRDQETIELQPREFSLLEYFMRNPGQPLSKTLILEKIWDYNFDPQTNVVDVLVCRLRSKIDKDFDEKMIQTLRGVGYVLKKIYKITGTIGFRVAAWYSGLILAGMIILFLITYFFLSSTLKTRDFQEIQSEISELTTEFNTDSIKGIQLFVHTHLSKRLKSILYIRIADQNNQTLFHFSPSEQEVFHLHSLEQLNPVEDKWITLKKSNNHPELNFQTNYLSPKHILQVGMSSRGRDMILHHFKSLFLLWALPLIIIGIVVGVFLSFRTLKPLRNIISTVEAIDIGRMDSRVPRTETRDELDELARLFNDMLDKISNLLTGMKESLDNVAHDLRTPLTRLRNISEAALHELPDGDQGRKSHESALEESERILQMLATLMDISEAETGVMRLNKRQVNLYDLVFPIYDLYLIVAEEKDIQVKIDIPSDITIFADPNKISQVIANLLDNAVKFTSQKGLIKIQAYVSNNQVIIKISDTGIGIPEQDILKIWNRLFRGDQSRSQKGLGLGLSLVKAIVTAHSGDITVSSKLKSGTTFSIILQNKHSL